jgi:predicted glutamine amidotransferase
MCGIAGIWKLEETGYDFLPLIKELMKNSETRGTDATGVAYLAKREGTERTLFYHKMPIPPKQYAKEFADKIIPKDFKAIIIHNRHATQGDPKFNKNNHPFVANAPVTFAFIHNGIIHTKYAGPREKPAETDSVEVFLEIWDEIEKAPQPENRMPAIRAAMEKHDGSMTNAILFPEAIVIAKHSNPCYLAYIPHLKCIVFASTDTMLEKSLGCVLDLVNTIFAPFNITEMKNDTILQIDDRGITLGGELEVGKLRTSTPGETQWFSYGACEPAAAQLGPGRIKFGWGGGEQFEEQPPITGTVTRALPPVTPEEAKNEVPRVAIKSGDLVRDLEGWKLKYLVVYSVVPDGIWGIFGETQAEALKDFNEEKQFKPSTKGGNLKWTKSDRFNILQRGITRKGLPETRIKQSPPGGVSRGVAQVGLRVGDIVKMKSGNYIVVTKIDGGTRIEGYRGATEGGARNACNKEESSKFVFALVENIDRVIGSVPKEESESDQKLEEDWERSLNGEEAEN